MFQLLQLFISLLDCFYNSFTTIPLPRLNVSKHVPLPFSLFFISLPLLYRVALFWLRLGFRDGLVEVLRAMLSMHLHPAAAIGSEEVEAGSDEGTQDDIEPNPRVLTADQVRGL